MDVEDLKQLVAQGESERLEFKKTTGELRSAMTTLCALLNGSGGKVLFGVTNGGRILGQAVTDATLREVAGEIKKIEPPAVFEQTRVPVREGTDVLILESTVAVDVPYTYDGRPYKRIGPTTSPMPQSEYQQRLLARDHALHRWENQQAEHYSESDLDTEEIDRTIRDAIHSGRLESRSSDPIDALDRLQLRVDGQLLRAAVVLFGRKFMPFYPQCNVRLAKFKGTDKSEFLDQRQLHGHAFQILDEAMHFMAIAWNRVALFHAIRRPTEARRRKAAFGRGLCWKRMTGKRMRVVQTSVCVDVPWRLESGSRCPAWKRERGGERPI